MQLTTFRTWSLDIDEKRPAYICLLKHAANQLAMNGPLLLDRRCAWTMPIQTGMKLPHMQCTSGTLAITEAQAQTFTSGTCSLLDMLCSDVVEANAC